MDYKLTETEKYDDERGKLVVFLKNRNLKKSDKEFGQVYFITFSRKGIVRGNHYHKRWREWFGIVDGRVKIMLEDVRTKEHIRLILSANDQNYSRLEIGPYIAHTFKSLTNNAILLNYADKEWFSKDTFPYKLM